MLHVLVLPVVFLIVLFHPNHRHRVLLTVFVVRWEVLPAEKKQVFVERFPAGGRLDERI